MSTPKPLRVALLAYEGCMSLEVVGISDVLLMAEHVARAMGLPAADAIELRVVSVQRRSVKAAGGITLGAQAPRGKFDWLIVPGLEVVQGRQWPAKLARLQPELAFIQRSFALKPRATEPVVADNATDERPETSAGASEE